MEEEEGSLKYLKDQLNSLKPEPNNDIDLADYNSYQFVRSLKNLEDKSPLMSEARPNTQNLGFTERRNMQQPSSLGYNPSDSAHRRACSRGDFAESIKSLTARAPLVGSAVAYAKHRRAGSSSTSNLKIATEKQSYPTDIKHLEKLVKFTGANHRNITGGRS